MGGGEVIHKTPQIILQNGIKQDKFTVNTAETPEPEFLNF